MGNGDIFERQRLSKDRKATITAYFSVREMGIEIIEIDVNPYHVHIFFRYPPNYSLSYIAKKIKGVSSKRLREAFLHLREWREDPAQLLRI